MSPSGPFRIAFITPEYVSESSNGGGLGNYLAKMCRVLIACGHEPEVFVTSNNDETVTHDGVVVHRVNPSRWHSRLKPLSCLVSLLPQLRNAAEYTVALLAEAAALASALRRRDRVVSFDCVQSADYRGVGLFVRRRPGRPHLIRCSCASDLWGFSRSQWLLERLSIRRGDRVYAPSRFVAGHLSRMLGVSVDVIRPPFLPDTPPAQELVQGLPSRYLVHFGQIVPRKGSDFLAEALPIVWSREPSVRMVWAGTDRQDTWARCRSRWGDKQGNVVYLGAIGRSQLYQVLMRSEGSVLPSLVDNFPNTVIESLMHNRPVIGTRGSSIDELVVDGVNGLLVDGRDIDGLAAAILDVWRKKLSWADDLLVASPVWRELQPQIAVDNLRTLAMSARRY